MMLKGSITEDAYREELLRSHYYIFNSKEGKFLLKTLEQEFQNIKTAYILYWTPEQGEDLFTIFIDGRTIAFLEIEKNIERKWIFRKIKKHKLISINTSSIKDFVKGLSKTNQIKLEVAIDLSDREIQDK